MKMNPVYKRETMVSARSFRLTLVMLVFNGILAIVALLNMYSALEQMKQTAEVLYSSFLDLYIFVAVLEFIMVIFIMPALTAGSISGERERRTLEIMLTTRLTPAQIVVGKLLAAMSTIVLMITSSLPVLALVFVYGGVTVLDILILFISYVAAALFIGSLGICCSVVCRKTTIATVVSYVMVGVIVLGTYGMNWFSVYLNHMHSNAVLVSAGTAVGEATSGNLVYMLLFNPTTSFLMIMQRLTGVEAESMGISQWFGNHSLLELGRKWVGGSIMIQILMAAAFTAIAVYALTPGRRGGVKNDE